MTPEDDPRVAPPAPPIATGGWVDPPLIPLGVVSYDYPMPAALAQKIREQAQRQVVVAQARTWLRTPWHHAARVRGAGVDCGQLLAAVYEAAGVISHLETEPYNHDFMLHNTEEAFLGYVERYAHRVARPALPGDIALYRWGLVISHAAIVIEWPMVLHAYVPARRVVLDDAGANTALATRFAGIWSPWGAE